MSESKSTVSGGIGFSGLLTIVFIVLKLCGIGKVATWSWWWVLSPLWISAGLTILIFLVVFIVYVVAKNRD
jgi:membrane-anchored glycerophosphoryl diester phosphodiesterase (GDPDase)